VSRRAFGRFAVSFTRGVGHRASTGREKAARASTLSSWRTRVGDVLVVTGELPAVYPVVPSTGGVAVARTEVAKTDD